MKKLISCENIVKSYGEGMKKRNVLDDVSLDIEQGEFVSIMGSSGSGKSTLLYCLSGMDRINQGRVSFEDKVLADFKERELAELRKSNMGFIFQQPTMLRNLNILDNIILSSTIGNRKNMAEIRKKAISLMDEVGISELAKRTITQVSGGQLQRAGICRALMTSPEIIFGDEPTGALNSSSADEIMDILTKINVQGTTIMLVTHDAKVAARADRILFMSDGKIVNTIKLTKWRREDVNARIKTITTKMQEIGI